MDGMWTDLLAVLALTQTQLVHIPLIVWVVIVFNDLYFTVSIIR